MAAAQNGADDSSWVMSGKRKDRCYMNDIPCLPSNPAQSERSSNPTWISFGNAVAGGARGYNPFSFNDETDTSMMHGLTPYQPTGPNLQVAFYDSKPCVPSNSTGSRRQLSFPEVAAADDSSRVMPGERKDVYYMKGYVQGFKQKVSEVFKPSKYPDVYIDQDGKTTFKPTNNGCSVHLSSYQKGCIEGLKASLRTRGMDQLGNLFTASFY